MDGPKRKKEKVFAIFITIFIADDPFSPTPLFSTTAM